MSIQSTFHISREFAINRITKINDFIKDKNYIEIERNSFEIEYDIFEFINKYQTKDFSNLEKWTNRMLEDIMNTPFFRQSIFENYYINDN